MTGMKQEAAALAVQPAPSVAGLQAYKVAPPNGLLDLPVGATERPVLLPQLAAWARQAAGEVGLEHLGRYPQTRLLEAQLAAMHGVAPQQVLLTAGADEALDRVCRAVLAPGRKLVLTTPTFEMMPHYGRLSGAQVEEVAWGGGDLPLAELLAACRADATVLMLCSPNNPTGSVVRAPEVEQLVTALPHVLVVVDHAYVEFAAAEFDLTHLAARYPNVVVVRTLSKAWGMPGLRVGYALGDARVLGWMRAAGGPYSVATASVLVAAQRLEQGGAEVSAYVAQVRNERAALTTELQAVGVEVAPSQANFVLVRSPKAPWLRQGLASLGVSSRSFGEQALLRDALRLSCPGDGAALERLRAALRAVLKPAALLFDLDGVLADVSASYRAAIVATARALGVQVQPGDIARIKAAGNANNDWEVTRRLVAAAGGSATLAQVRAIFEPLYQGTPEVPGLRAQERLLATPALLARLAARLPLGVVTGRPRRDAERFLEEAGVLQYFQAMVCMEEAPLKPDPAPVTLCLARLKVQAAWMVGDTVDDVRAARAAGVVSLGVVAPGDDKEAARAVLQQAGAARVLKDLSELEELLS